MKDFNSALSTEVQEYMTSSLAGNAIDATFVGWTEQYVYGADDRFTNVEPI